MPAFGRVRRQSAVNDFPLRYALLVLYLIMYWDLDGFETDFKGVTITGRKRISFHVVLSYLKNEKEKWR